MFEPGMSVPTAAVEYEAVAERESELFQVQGISGQIMETDLSGTVT